MIQRRNLLLLWIKEIFCLFRDLIFERAYCEYRLNRIEDASNTLKSLDRELNEREQELLAQVVSYEYLFFLFVLFGFFQSFLNLKSIMIVWNIIDHYLKIILMNINQRVKRILLRR